jgi:hypothetical protein
MNKQFSTNPKDIFSRLNRQFIVAKKLFPELKKEGIFLKFSTSSYIMRSLPVFKSLFANKDKRKYVVVCSTNHFSFLEKLNDRELCSWFIHELGHVKDMQNKTMISLCWFGLKYFFCDSFAKSVEVFADSQAINKGYGAEFISSTKKSLNISNKYKKRFTKRYTPISELKNLQKTFENK